MQKFLDDGAGGPRPSQVTATASESLGEHRTDRSAPTAKQISPTKTRAARIAEPSQSEPSPPVPQIMSTYPDESNAIPEPGPSTRTRGAE